MMETLYEMTKRLGKGQGEEMMWDTVKIVSDAITEKMSEKDKGCLMAKIYGSLSGGHYDEDYAEEAVSKMYYVDKDGVKRYGPYWTIPDIHVLYEANKKMIPPEYNEWDWYVVFNMLGSDLWELYHNWWPSISASEFAQKITQSTVSWLNDPDNPYGTSKVWGYLNQGK